MPRTLISCLLAAAALVGISRSNVIEDDTPAEIGTVKWGRDYAAAQQQSKKTGKPLFLFFQEVPG